jgi:hypothetical protein
MTKKPLLVAGGFVLAIVTAVAATLYLTRDERVPVPTVTVIVATEDIPPEARLKPLIRRDVFVEVDIPRSVVIATAVTDIYQLKAAESTTALILENEQIPLQRLGGSFI